MKKLIIILMVLSSCSKEDEEIILECVVDEIHSEDLGCHLPTKCEMFELNLYKDNGQRGCFVTYESNTGLEVDKGCILLADHQRKVDSVFCNSIIGYGYSWTAKQNCDC
jgi:hypothetical protein